MGSERTSCRKRRKACDLHKMKMDFSPEDWIRIREVIRHEISKVFYDLNCVIAEKVSQDEKKRLFQ